MKRKRIHQSLSPNQSPSRSQMQMPMSVSMPAPMNLPVDMNMGSSLGLDVDVHMKDDNIEITPSATRRAPAREHLPEHVPVSSYATNIHSNPYDAEDVPPSPCDTSTTSSPATPRSCDDVSSYGNGIMTLGHGLGNGSGSGNGKFTIQYSGDINMNRSGRKIIPVSSSSASPKLLSSPRSPSAPLDPQYASRLQLHSHSHSQSHHPHREQERERREEISASAEKDRYDALLMPPPTLWRNKNGDTNANNSNRGSAFRTGSTHTSGSGAASASASFASSSQYRTPVNSQEEGVNMNEVRRGLTSVSASPSTSTPTTTRMEIESTQTPQRESPLRSHLRVDTHTPLCTPEGRRSNNSNLTPTSTKSSSSSSRDRDRKTFDFYTPRRSPRSLIGHKIHFSTPARSITSLSEGTMGSLSSSGSRNGSGRNPKQDSSPRYSDRFIPSRSSSNLSFSVWDNDDDMHHHRRRRSDGSSDGGNGSSNGSQGGSGGSGGQSHNVPHQASEDDTPRSQDANAHYSNSNPQQPPLLNMLLRSELLGENIDPSSQNSQFGTYGSSSSPSSSGHHSSNQRYPLREGGNNYLRYNNQSQRQRHHNGVFSSSSPQYVPDPTTVVDSFSLSPVRRSSNHHFMSMPQKRKRKISKVPFKVLDAPALADDFYLNLVDWSSLNVLAVGLGSCVYLWSACTSKVTKLCDLSTSGNSNNNQDNDRGSATENAVTSVSWTQRGTHLAVGVNNGEVQLWDTVKCKMIRTMGGHSARIGALSWSGPTLASGSRDRLIYLRDMRVQQPFTARLASHKQEVCGLKWSFDEPAHLASGGNDNKLLVWDIKKHRQPTHRFAEHTAAVKAIAWSPHQHGLLASGGGTADRCIRFWNALSGSPLNAIDTGSQVCNLAWSQNCNEIVSTHGYSLNQIALWKYPTMQKVATLTGHTYRVLYLAMSPDGSTIVTGAGDETLRFWQVFPGPRCNDKNGKNGLLFPSSPFSVLR